jgi:hypothetical protein
MFEEDVAKVSEEELLSKLSDTENNFIERKTRSNHVDWLKTAVAFANSCPIGQPGILYIGVKNDGTLESRENPTDFEKLQKSVSEKLNSAWPPIYFVIHILKKDALEFIAVVIWGSPLRPHFSGPAYIRVGPETKDASEEQYDLMIAQRSSKVRALLQMKGQTVHWHAWSPVSGTFAANGNGQIVDCNQFFVTISGDNYKKSLPIDKLSISFDHLNNRPTLLAKID